MTDKPTYPGNSRLGEIEIIEEIQVLRTSMRRCLTIKYASRPAPLVNTCAFAGTRRTVLW